MKTRRNYQRTSAAGISQYLHRQGVERVACTSQVLQDRWVIVVNCQTMTHANVVWVALKKGGYNLLGQFHEWVVVGEKQNDSVGVM